MKRNAWPSDQTALFLIQLVMAYEWTHAGIEKIASGTFVSSLPQTLEAFASKTTFRWYAASVLQNGYVRSPAFAQMVQWGEILTGIGLVCAVIFALVTRGPRRRASAWLGGFSALVGAVMNMNFYLAASTTSVSTAGENAVMFWIQVILMVWWIRVARDARVSRIS